MLELKKFFTSKLMLLHIASRALEQAGYKSTSLEVKNFLSSNIEHIVVIALTGQKRPRLG